MRSSPSFIAIVAIALLFAACTEPLPNEGPMPELGGAATWFNSPPLSKAELKGKVVLVDFWTYSCVNCLRVIPYVKAWQAKYADQGLVVVGVHAPEFDFEEDSTNVKAAIERLGITYPVVLDNDMVIWKAFNNKFWPAHYFVDVNGVIRYHHFGERDYAKSEEVIRTLLKDVKLPKGVKRTSGAKGDTSSFVNVSGDGAAAEVAAIRSPETYLGYLRLDRLANTQEITKDSSRVYSVSRTLAPDAWGFSGKWRVVRQYAEAEDSGATITYRFRARDVNLVLGPALRGQSVRFRVTVDGKAPGADAGVDVDADGKGVIAEHRMYQLIRQQGSSRDRVFTITFYDAGGRAYAFTFG